jgi:cytochrome P450
MGRQVLNDYELGEYVAPSGSIILMSPWVMHHNPRYFPEPFKFDPDRWTPQHRDQRPRFSYFPFGGGPRVCIGEGFAWMEGVVLLAGIAQRWRLRLAPGHRVETRPLITLRPKYGMRMTVASRAKIDQANSPSM